MLDCWGAGVLDYWTSGKQDWWTNGLRDVSLSQLVDDHEWEKEEAVVAESSACARLRHLMRYPDDGPHEP